MNLLLEIVLPVAPTVAILTTMRILAGRLPDPDPEAPEHTFGEVGR